MDDAEAVRGREAGEAAELGVVTRRLKMKSIDRKMAKKSAKKLSSFPSCGPRESDRPGFNRSIEGETGYRTARAGRGTLLAGCGHCAIAEMAKKKSEQNF